MMVLLNLVHMSQKFVASVVKHPGVTLMCNAMQQ